MVAVERLTVGLFVPPFDDPRTRVFAVMTPVEPWVMLPVALAVRVPPMLIAASVAILPMACKTTLKFEPLMPPGKLGAYSKRIFLPELRVSVLAAPLYVMVPSP